MGKRRVAVVGGGISGTVCASELTKHDFDVVVFESGNGLGGRMSTRRYDREDGTQVTFDHGAQFFSVSDPRFDSLVQEWERAGVVGRWEGRFGSIPNDDNTRGHLQPEDTLRTAVTLDSEHDSRYVGMPGMNSVCKHLQSMQGFEVRKRTKVTGFTNPSADADGKWSLAVKPSKDPGADPVMVSGFDAVVVTDLSVAQVVYGEPAPLESAGVDGLLKRMQSAAPREARFALMVAFEGPVPIEFDALQIHNHPVLEKASRNSSKPMRSKGADQWVLLSTQDYAMNRIRGRLSRPGTTVHSDLLDRVVEGMYEAFESLVEEDLGAHPLPPTVLKVAHRWGGAFPAEPLGDGAEEFLVDGSSTFYACGDFVKPPVNGVQGFVEGAALSGLAAAQRILQVTQQAPAL
eukprot:CAMPEP_0118930750 /NCGR_PEP_ID=MMETSP1169-20130426/7330_1 /TAXON_ID=36882 /ORGANISM="Pyramimonas obovata, Strain CCMP722" /LENGTH=402 /DNA_ID=CAMNT_0006873153 /DNA_START=174 /DNA_END=1382 /DNA_ORIENTATION=+